MGKALGLLEPFGRARWALARVRQALTRLFFFTGPFDSYEEWQTFISATTTPAARRVPTAIDA